MVVDKIVVLSLIASLPGFAGTAVAAGDYESREDVQAYVAEIAGQHDFDADALLHMLGSVRHRDDIIERISKPAEKVWTWGRYKKHLVDEQRIREGIEFGRTHAATLARAQEVYGVAPEVVLAILGIETRYGRIAGTFPVLESLMTLGFDYPPRSAFFRKELTEFLLLAREEGKDPTTLTGSYAGAMGYGQFISSSYRHYAVDFDSDGVRDIWTNPVDAIGSVANYFHRHRWSGEGPRAVRVSLKDEIGPGEFDTGLEQNKTVADYVAMGVVDPELPADLHAKLYRVEADEGPEYWLALHDFYVITRYNRSHLYALAVHHLADLIRAEL